MCGIIYAQRNGGKVSKGLLKRYREQRTRGTQGFGFIAIYDGKVRGVDRFEDEKDAEKALRECQSSAILFHHRMPTSTPNYKDMTHPIVVKNKMLDKDYYVVHNGVLKNEDALKLEHEKLGFKYTTSMTETVVTKTKNETITTESESFNDSESLAIEVALFLDGKKTTIDTIGTVSFICIETTKRGVVKNIHYGHNYGNPLVAENENGMTFLKSIGAGQTVTENQITTIDFKTNAKSITTIPIGKLYNEITPVQGYEKITPWGGHSYGYSNDPYEEKTQHLPIIGDEQRYLTDPYYEIDDEYEEYEYTDEHLLDLWEEMESLKLEIKNCGLFLDSGTPHTHEDEVFNNTTLYNAKRTLADLTVEANIIEDVLGRRNIK